MTHSPLPWTYHNVNGVKDWIEDANGNIQIENVGSLDGPLIVRAVNAHDALVKALESVAEWFVNSLWDEGQMMRREDSATNCGNGLS